MKFSFQKILILVTISFASSQATNEKVLIFTHAFNRPDFIEIQKKTFDAFLQDDYELVVFNDASNNNSSSQIEQMCKNLQIRCIRIPQTLHNGRPAGPGYRHMDGIKFAFEQVGFDHDGPVMLIDSDIFLIKELSISRWLEEYDIIGQIQGRANQNINVQHLSPAIAIFNMKKLPNKKTINFEGGTVEGLGCDVGGHTYYYLQNNPSVKLYNMNVLHIGALMQGTIQCKQCNNMSCEACTKKLIDHNFSTDAINFIHSCPTDKQSSLDIEFFLDSTFLHYRSGSNWRNMTNQYHMQKTNALDNLLNAILPKP